MPIPIISCLLSPFKQKQIGADWKLFELVENGRIGSELRIIEVLLPIMEKSYYRNKHYSKGNKGMAWWLYNRVSGKLQMTECLFEDDENKMQPGSNRQEFYNMLVSDSRVCFQNNLAKHLLEGVH